MCGICGLLGRDAPDPGLVEAHERGDRTSRPRPRRRRGPRPLRARLPAPLDHRPRRPATSPSRTSAATWSRSSTASSTTSASSARELEAAGPRDPRHGRLAADPARLRGVGPRLRRAARGHVRDRALGPRGASGSCSCATGSARSRSLYARLPDGSLAFASETKALLALPGSPRELDLEQIDAYLALQYVPALGAAGGGEGAARAPTSSSRAARSASSATGRRSPHRATGGDWVEPRARRGDGSGAAAARRRRPARCAPLGRDRLVDRRRRDGTGPGEPVRTFTVGFPDPRYDERPTHAPSPRGTGRSTRSSRSSPRPSSRPARACLRRAVRRRSGAAAAARLRGDAEARQGRARRRRRRRGVRRLRAIPCACARGRFPRRWLALRSPRRGAGVSPARRSSVRAVSSTSRRSRAAERYARLVEVFPLELRRRLWTDEARAHATADAAAGRRRPPRSSTSSRTSPATCCRSRTSPRWRSRSSSARRSSTTSVVELGLALPPELAFGKAALKQAFAADLPPEIASRRKSGFGVPLDRWFRSELRARRRGAPARGRRTAASSAAPSSSGSCASTPAVAPTTGTGSGASACSSSGSAPTSTRRGRASAQLREPPPRLRDRARGVRAAARSPSCCTSAARLANFEKSDLLARVFVETGTFGYVPGEPSAYTQPLYGWFLIAGLLDRGAPLVVGRRRPARSSPSRPRSSSTRSAGASSSARSASSPRSSRRSSPT